jgi:hypothetical protein
VLIGFASRQLIHEGNHTDCDLVLRSGVLRREEPEEQLVFVVGVVADGQETGIGLADIEVDIRESSSIDGEF